MMINPSRIGAIDPVVLAQQPKYPGEFNRRSKLPSIRKQRRAAAKAKRKKRS